MMEHLLPKLRFPEFKEEWKENKLQDFCTFFSGGTPTSSNKKYYNGNIPFIKSGEISSEKTEQFLTDEGLNSSSAKLINEGDILYALYGATSGQVSISKLSGAINQAVLCIRPINMDRYFLKEILSFNKQNIVDKYIQGGQGNLSGAIVKNLSFNFPSLEEQTKIADFLGAVDNQLDILNQKKEKLKTYKKGVMQQLFSKQLRFKDENGNDFPEWEETKIGNVFKFKQGIQCEVNEQSFTKNENQYRFIRIIDLTNPKEPPRYINYNNIDNIICETDLFMVRYGSPGLIGYGFKGVIANNLFRLIPNREINNLFYKYELEYLNDKIISLSSSTSMPAISFKSLGSLIIKNPSLEEQNKIADYLSAIDKQIETVSAQTQKTENYKKGLLQQMFV